jgi:hypothetical protein
MDIHQLTRALAIGRVSLGVSALLMTKLFVLTFLGSEATRNGVTKVAVRMYGIREVAIGFALLDALVKGQPLDRDLGLGLLVDTSDVFCIFIGRRGLPVRGRILGLGLAGGFAVAEKWALSKGELAMRKSSDAPVSPR